MSTKQRYLFLSRAWYPPLFFLLLLAFAGCGHLQQNPAEQPPSTSSDETPVYSPSYLGYVLQFGAFAQLDNALAMTQKLKGDAIDAYFYIDDDGLYKVRMGNYNTASEAKSAACLLTNKQLISEYYIVPPTAYLVDRLQPRAEAVRKEIVRTARRFIGIPYKWGGTSAQDGFDCSGLSMVVYHLNGLNIPRTSRIQYEYGYAIASNRLQPADLVFFSTDMSGTVNHVGIYAGDGKFIHAPRSGKKITFARMNSTYFKKRFVGARRFI